MKPKTQTVVRVVLLVIALANSVVSSLGIIPEELLDNPGVYQAVSNVITAVMALIAAWKNNSFTPEAIEADEYLAKLRQERSS